jgi:hypothetical protein
VLRLPAGYAKLIDNNSQVTLRQAQREVLYQFELTTVQKNPASVAQTFLSVRVFMLFPEKSIKKNNAQSST